MKYNGLAFIVGFVGYGIFCEYSTKKKMRELNDRYNKEKYNTT